MEIYSLAEKPEYFDQVIALIEESFDYKEQHSFKVDFYPLMNQDNHQNCWLLLKEGKLIAHIGVRLADLNDGSRFAMMGGIAVDETYRGQGLFAKLFEQILSKYLDQDFIILWSDQHDLYKKYDFELVGNQYTLSWLEGFQSSFEKVKELNPDIKDQVRSLYKELMKSELSLKRTEKDWENLWKITSSDLYIVKEGKNILSYFFMNKGQDLPGVIHEAYFSDINHLEAARTLGSLWLPHQYQDFSEFTEKLGLIKFNKKKDISDLWISGLDSI